MRKSYFFLGFTLSVLILAGCGPSGPTLRIGDDSWVISSVNVCSVIYENGDPDQEVIDRAWPPEEAAFIAVNFDCSKSRPLSHAISELYSGGDINIILNDKNKDIGVAILISVTDEINGSACNKSIVKFHASELFEKDQQVAIFDNGEFIYKPENAGLQKSLTLEFAGLSPSSVVPLSIELPEGTYQADCPFK